MRNSGQRVDLAMYFLAVPLFLRHLSVMVAPLLAAIVALLLGQIGQVTTDPLGGFGAGLFGLIAQFVYLLAFGIAVIQASNAWRGRKASFDAAWIEGRSKLGGIALAAIGFLFVTSLAGMIGVYLGPLAIVLLLAAAFFLIFTIPAAAIGGMPGSLALQASIRSVRAQPLPAAILAIVYVLIWILMPQYLGQWIGPYIPPNAGNFVFAAINALALGYLAFPFAKQYDEVAFRGLW
jgi:hypothetical protein